jgi:hypothetical protein
MEWQVDVAISCFIFGSLDSLQIFQQRREYLAKGLNLLTALKQAGILHANKDWTGWFNNSLRSLKSIAQSLIYRQKTSEQALRVDRPPPFLSLAPPPPRLPLRSSVLPRRTPCCSSPRSAPLPAHKSIDRRHCAPAPDRSRPAQRRWCRQAVWAGSAPFSLNRLSIRLLLPQGSDAHPAPHAQHHAFPVR